MTNYKRFDIDKQTTTNLKKALAHCNGVKTVTAYNATIKDHKATAIYHYNALICVYDHISDIMYYNYSFATYSASTSRVRNQATRLLIGLDCWADVPNSNDIHNNYYKNSGVIERKKYVTFNTRPITYTRGE